MKTQYRITITPSWSFLYTGNLNTWKRFCVRLAGWGVKKIQ